MLRLNEINVKCASGSEELEWIFRLRYENYLRKGYISPNRSRVMRDKWDESPATTHFVASLENTMVGAVRVIMDSETGLPMERVFGREVSALRSSGAKLAEASTLVTTFNCQESNHGVWLRLCREVWEKAEAAGVDELCIAVTRNHLPFYRKLRFKTMGPGRCYGSLNGIFAYALHVPVKQFRLKNRLSDIPPGASLGEYLLEPRRQDKRI